MLILPWAFQGAPFILCIAPLRASILNLFCAFQINVYVLYCLWEVGKHFGAYLFCYFSINTIRYVEFDNLLIFI